jgi:hypothetical protein
MCFCSWWKHFVRGDIQIGILRAKASYCRRKPEFYSATALKYFNVFIEGSLSIHDELSRRSMRAVHLDNAGERCWWNAETRRDAEHASGSQLPNVFIIPWTVNLKYKENDKLLSYLQLCTSFKTLRAGNANLRHLRFCVTTVKDGWRKIAF